MVHTELPEWPCPDCGKKFKRKFDLNRHRVTVHLGVRNFPCDLCGKRFADMKDMTRHKNAVHYGMKIKWNSRKVKGEPAQRRTQKRRNGAGHPGGVFLDPVLHSGRAEGDPRDRGTSPSAVTQLPAQATSQRKAWPSVK